MLTRIRNAYSAKHESVCVPFSCLKEQILAALHRGGYIQGYHLRSDSDSVKILVVTLRYVGGEPAIGLIKRISKPSRRVYTKIKNAARVLGGLGSEIFSTPRGVLLDSEARFHHVGGERLFVVTC